MKKSTQKRRSDSGSKPEEYDLVILGSGAAGKVMAWTSAQKGQRVVVIVNPELLHNTRLWLRLIFKRNVFGHRHVSIF